MLNVDNSNFDFSKINSFLNQKSKNYFLLEKKKEKSMMCFGLMYTEDIAFKSRWVNDETCLNVKSSSVLEKGTFESRNVRF